MAFQFKMPDIGEGIAEGEIVKIDIKVGDTIQEDDILFEVQNDKSVEEIPSPVSGTITAVLVSEGTVARVGDIIVVIDDGSGPAEAAQAASPAASAPAAPAAPAAKPEPAKPFVGSAEREERVKLTPMRKAISKAMVNSKHTAPHVTLHDQVEVSKLWDHRKKFKDVAAAQGTKLTFLPYVVKALAVAMKKFPVLNASIDDATQEIVYKNYINTWVKTTQ